MASIKDRVKSRFPNLVRFVKGLTLRFRPPKDIFEDYYRRNKWRDRESVSGPGSSLRTTETLRAELPELLQELEIHTMLDIPCGDFGWMKEVDLGSISYLGGDIVDDLIARNSAAFTSPTRRFAVMNLLEDRLPTVDLIFCRDCLVHFSEKHIRQALENIKASQSTYLATTIHTLRFDNADIVTGQWRAINLQMPPFNFPRPIMMIDDMDEGPEEGKSIGVWRIADL